MSVRLESSSGPPHERPGRGPCGIASRRLPLAKTFDILADVAAVVRVAGHRFGTELATARIRVQGDARDPERGRRLCGG